MTSRALALVATMSMLTAVFVAGCAQRQEIIEQTVAAKGQDVAAEAEASHVPEELLTWEVVQEVDPGFEKAVAVAFDGSGALYIAGDEAVRKMTAAGQVEWELPVGGEPNCLTIGPDDAMVVGLRDRVAIYDQGGQLVDAVDIEEPRTWITSVAIGPDAIYVADAGNRRVLRYDADRQSSVFVTKDEARGIPALSVPSPHLDIEAIPAISSSPTELVVVNPGRHSIQYHSLPGGDLMRSWHKSTNAVEGFGGCCNPTNIAVLSDGRVVTSEKGLPRVKVYSSEGDLLSVIAPPDEFARSASGIDLAADASGRVAVLDPKRNVVRLYEERTADQETVSE